MGKEEWKFVVGNEGSDRWVMVSPDEKIFIIGEWNSTEHGNSKTIRVEYNREIVLDIRKEKNNAPCSN